MKFTTTLVLLFVLPIAARRVTVEQQLQMETQPAQSSSNCPQDISKPASGQSVHSHFFKQRQQLGLLNVGQEMDHPKTCTKRDVCLLMRQLDMDFYERARAGTLVDADYNTPPEVTWLHSGTCRNHDRGEGKRYAPVMDEAACRSHVKKSGKIWEDLDATGKGKLLSKRVRKVSTNDYPAGCSIEVNNKVSRNKIKHASKGIKVRMNTLTRSTKDAGHFVENGTTYSWGSDKTTQVLCEHDRTLSPSAASYYSPYKLKQNMVERTKMSTSCSFGMYAHLAHLKKTQSSCAHILTYKTNPKYYSAADALKQAEQMSSSKAAKVREYVEKIRQKFVLIEQVTSHWCPSIWDQAVTAGSCSVPRVTDMAAEDDETLAKLFTSDGNSTRADKLAFSDDFCGDVPDESLSDVLAGAPEAPPDFFRDATI